MTSMIEYPPLQARYTSLSDLEPEELVLSHMPKWLVGTLAKPEIIEALNKAMSLSRTYHLQVGQQFGELQSVETYCSTLLTEELNREFGKIWHIHNDRLVLAHDYYVVDDSMLLTLRHRTAYEEPKTLLWSALQNFSASEAHETGLSENSYFLKGRNITHYRVIQPYRFAALCRRLDLGQHYQTYLQNFLKVAVPDGATPTAAQAATHSGLELLKAYDLEVDTHIAFLSKTISGTTYKALLALVAQNIGTASTVPVMFDGKIIFQSSLSILDTVVDGVVVFSSDSLLLHPANRLVVYIPNDPVAPLREYASLQAFIDVLKVRLMEPEFQEFFGRYIALSAKPSFLKSLTAMPAMLALTAQPLGKTATQYLVASHLKKMFADAQVLAVPTSVLDESEREEKWQLYKSVGLFLANVGALFVPGLGELMLAVAAVQMLGEVYEGVKDWAQGDTDHARMHLLNVAKDIATAAAVAVGVSVIKKAASSLSQAGKAYLERFEPITREDGSARLWNRDLEQYELKTLTPSHEVADAQGIFTVRGKKHIELEGKKYPVEFDRKIKQWRIPHLKRREAFRPALLHNREGAWQHVHERPLEWRGSGCLIGRLGAGANAVGVDEATLEQIRLLTNTPEDLMRRVHLENLPPPPLLKVSLKRFEIDRQINRFIEKMERGEHSSPEFADMQMSLLAQLRDWPVGKELRVVDGSNTYSAQYRNPSWTQTSSVLNVTPATLGEGKLLETLLKALSASERKMLIGSNGAVTSEKVQMLVQQLTHYAREHRSQMFERLYEVFNTPHSAEASSVQAVFPGLPGPVVQALTDSASPADHLSLVAGKVPLQMAEKARSYLHEVRLNRAFEGFYLDSINPQDTEILARHFIPRLTGWPDDLAIEVREGSTLGPVLYRFGAEQEIPRRMLVKGSRGYSFYRLHGDIYQRDLQDAMPLLSTALFHALTVTERNALAIPVTADASVFNARLAKLAVEWRTESTQILGMQPIKPWFKAPAQLSRTKVGYPLCGLNAGAHSRSLQRRVRNLYREIDDDQVLQLLDALVEEGLNPLTVLRQRKRERAELCDYLQSWIDYIPASEPPQGEHYDQTKSKYEASTLIVRSWDKNPGYMPWASNTESYSLNLDGLRLSELPVIPARIDFSHIQTLKLNNMGFSRGANEFLSHFTGITTLEMDNNGLVDLPSQLLNLPDLSSLSLVRNRLNLSATNGMILKALSKLEVLNLNYNLLGEGLDLNNMAYLRRVFLRRTGTREWPQSLITRPFLEMADLRENRITEIPEEVYQVPASIPLNTSLTGNPLSATSRLRLARYVLQGGASMGIRGEEFISETAAYEFWTSGITSAELARRDRLWRDLRQDPASDDFFTVLTRLTTTADAQIIRNEMARRVWEMIEAANENELLRSNLLDVAASPRSCTDSVAITFSSLEQQVQLSRISRNPRTREAELLMFARRQFRLDQLNRIATEHYSSLLNIGGVVPDELEINLAYRIGLAKALELPGQPQNMLFSVIAGVTQANISKAKIEIELVEKTSALVDFVCTRDYWIEHLKSTNKTEFSSLSAPYFNQLSELLRLSPEMTSARYLRRVSDIRNTLDIRVVAWSRSKTQELLPVPLKGRASV